MAILAVYKDNYADEFDVTGFQLFQNVTSWKIYLYEAKYGTYPRMVELGNAEIVYDNPNMLLDHIEARVVSDNAGDELYKVLFANVQWDEVLTSLYHSDRSAVFGHWPTDGREVQHGDDFNDDYVRPDVNCFHCGKNVWSYAGKTEDYINGEMARTIYIGSHHEDDDGEVYCQGSNQAIGSEPAGDN